MLQMSGLSPTSAAPLSPARIPTSSIPATPRANSGATYGKEGMPPPADNAELMRAFAGMTTTKRPRPLVDDIRAAARTFPTATAVVDGIHPRHVALLPDAGIQYIADLFEVWEYAGCPLLPEQTLMVKMIPKPTGGDRPIGLFPVLYRIWGKLRQPLLKEWTR